MRDLSRYNVDTKYGRMALDYVLSSLKGNRNVIASPPSWYTGEFFSGECQKYFLPEHEASFLLYR